MLIINVGLILLLFLFMIILQAKVDSVNITTTAKVTPSSSVPEMKKDNNVHKVGRPARVTRIPSIA